MHLEQRADGWWIVEVPGCEDCGPYATKALAESDKRGMSRFHRNQNDRDFICGGDKINNAEK